MVNILVTNDDGIRAPALNILQQKLSPLGRVTIVAPEGPRDATGNSLTLHKPVRVNRIESTKYSVSGTTADCVRIGVLTILNDNVDIVISGINKGANLGDDVSYSGTVAGAREAGLLGIPSLAVSLVINGIKNFNQAAEITKTVTKKLLKFEISPRKILNMNIPDLPDGKVKGIKITKLGKRIYDRKVRERTDPAGRKYYWIIGEKAGGIEEEGSDFEAISHGYASLTPLTMDYTEYGLIEKLENWNLNL